MQRRLSPLALRRLLSPPPAPVAAERSPPALRRRRRRLWGTFQSPVGDSLVWGFGVPFASSWKPPRLSSPRGLCVVAASGWSGGSELPLARRFCTYDERDDRALAEEAEKKFGWILNIFFIGTAGLVGYQFFPYISYMGDNLLQQSSSLLHVKYPLFKRMGASRLARFAVDGNFVELFGRHSRH